MPTYEYRCTTCGTPFEARRSITESEDGVACPQGHTAVRRVFSVFASTGGTSDAPMVGGGGGGGCCGGACGCG